MFLCHFSHFHKDFPPDPYKVWQTVLPLTVIALERKIQVIFRAQYLPPWERFSSQELFQSHTFTIDNRQSQLWICYHLSHIYHINKGPAISYLLLVKLLDSERSFYHSEEEAHLLIVLLRSVNQKNEEKENVELRKY